MPHTPHNPPERILKKYRDQTPYISVAKYWAMCEWFDETCGELLNHLDAKKLSENTIVVYVCDNGWITRTDMSRYAARSKRSQFDAGTRTPIMVRWPNHMTPRIDKTHLASSIDIVPTVLNAVGLKPTKEMDGIDLLDDGAVKKRQSIYGEILEHDIQSMTDAGASLRYRWVIRGDWKLIVPNLERVPGAKKELYNLKRDPNEQRDLAGRNAKLVEELGAELDGWWKAGT